MPRKRKLLATKHFNPFLWLLLAFAAVVLFTVVNQGSSEKVKGVLIAERGSGSSGSGDSEGSGSGSGGSDSGSSGSGGSGSEGSQETKTESTTPAGTRIRTETQDVRQKTEVKISEDEKVKTEVREDRTRIDVYQGGVKVRYEVRDGRTIIKAENEARELSDTEIVKIVERMDKSGIKIATTSGELVVSRNQVGAASRFPLQVDLNTNELVVTTPAGEKRVAVLPDQAVQNMLAANVISRLGAQELVSQVVSGQVSSIKDIITLGEQNGIPVYEIFGFSDQKLLGFIPVAVPKTVVVSGETGEVVATQQSLVSQIADLFSF